MKLNINYPLTGAAYRICLEMNAGFIVDGDSQVRFVPDGPYPHLTLLMGDVAPNRITELTGVVRTSVQRLYPGRISLTRPYCPAPDSRYVFLGINPSSVITTCKRLLAKHVEGIFDPANYGDVDTVPHVTIACFPDVARSLVVRKMEFTDVAWIPSTVAISVTGDHGVCTTRIAEIPLNSSDHTPRAYFE
ncbi:MAG: 2'-5' RNA ligase family protein [bacterium]|nr:2'-5' RNA ligase family protein [bacterium]